MIGALVDALVARLQTHLGTGNLMEGIVTVAPGDEMPRQTDEHPLVTVDLVRDASSPDGYQAAAPIVPVVLELAARLYVCSVVKGNTPARTALDLYWRVDAGTQKGLKIALRGLPAVEAAGTKFLLSLGDARPLRKGQSPQGRWTYALEVPLTARAHVGRN